MSDDRLDRFLRWPSALSGQMAVAERRLIAAELLALAQGRPVRDEDVARIVGARRASMAGARAIVLAQTVGEDLVRWERERAPEAAPPSETIELDVEPAAPARPARQAGASLGAAPPPAPPVMPLAAQAIFPPVLPEPTTKRWLLFGAWGGILLLAMFLVLIRPRCFFPGGDVPVQGTFVAKHVGLSLTFPASSWKHVLDLDDKETQGGYERRVSVFYRGAELSHYDGQLTLVVLRNKSSTAATDTQVRTVIGTQRMGNYARNTCLPRELGGRLLERCVARVSALGGSQVALEYFFQADDSIIYVRGLFKTSAAINEDLPGSEAGSDTVSSGHKEEERAIEEVDAMVSSLELQAR